MKNLFVYVSLLLVLILLPSPTFAHRDSCHRWHSCPSDTGSYVCGDLGYDSECPGGVPVQKAPIQAEQGVQPTALPTVLPTSRPTRRPLLITRPTRMLTLIPTHAATPTATLTAEPTKAVKGIQTVPSIPHAKQTFFSWVLHLVFGK
jgi:hypothetical protein